VHGGHDPDTGALAPPVQPSTTFARDDGYDLVSQYLYGRNDSPAYAAVERLAADLDGGAEALLFASGMAGITTVLETVSPGGRVVAPRIMYHGTRDWMIRLAELGRIDLDLVGPVSDEAVAVAVARAPVELVWIETPANPTWEVLDVTAAAAAAHAAGGVLVVDSTVAPPVTSRPLALGADLVVHSATKYYNGHSDVLAGLVVTKERDARWEELTRLRTATGGVAGAFAAWLLHRGMRTMPLRFARASATALAVARHLERHPMVERVLYPGLESHPGHDVAARQMTGGFGGMVSVLVDGDADAARAVASRLELFVSATSLGGVESLVEHRATIEGPDSAVPPNLLRLSIGIESPGDLTADLDQALG
jgi:cystathionine gamma-synthase